MKKLLLSAMTIVTAALALQAADLTVSAVSSAKVFPNPWRVDRHANTTLQFDGMPAGSQIKIFTVSGHMVRELTADSNGTAPWDRLNKSGSHVASGVYIYLIIDPQGNEKSGKLAIIR